MTDIQNKIEGEAYLAEHDAAMAEVRQEIRRHTDLLAASQSPRGVRQWLDGLTRRAHELGRLLDDQYRDDDAEVTTTHSGASLLYYTETRPHVDRHVTVRHRSSTDSFAALYHGVSVKPPGHVTGLNHDPDGPILDAVRAALVDPDARATAPDGRVLTGPASGYDHRATEWALVLCAALKARGYEASHWGWPPLAVDVTPEGQA